MNVFDQEKHKKNLFWKQYIDVNSKGTNWYNECQQKRKTFNPKLKETHKHIIPGIADGECWKIDNIERKQTKRNELKEISETKEILMEEYTRRNKLKVDILKINIKDKVNKRELEKNELILEQE